MCGVGSKFVVAFSGALCYTDKVFAPETDVGNGVKADVKSAF